MSDLMNARTAKGRKKKEKKKKKRGQNDLMKTIDDSNKE